MKRFVIAIIVFVVVVGGVFTVYQVAEEGQNSAARHTETVTNETLNQEYDAYQFVSKALGEFTAGFTDNVTVYNSTGTELTEGTDYEWNETDGTILFLSSQSTTENNDANVTYQYYENDQNVKEIAGPLDVITGSFEQVALMGAGFVFVVIFLAIAGYAATKIFSNRPRSNR